MNETERTTTTINISRLKEFALELPKKSALRDLLLSEKEYLSPYEYVAKLEIWLKLLDFERQ